MTAWFFANEQTDVASSNDFFFFVENNIFREFLKINFQASQGSCVCLFLI